MLFERHYFIHVTLRTGIDLTKQILPCGEDYLYLPHAASAVSRAKARVAGWSDEKMRRAATPIFQGLEYELSGGQQQLLLRLSNFHGLSRIPREAANGVLALLKDGAAD